MKRYVVIGLGNFGSTVARTLYSNGHEVIALDVDASKVDAIAAHVTKAVVGDGRTMQVLDRVGASGADAGVGGTGDDITASILATMALRDLGVRTVYVKVISPEHARVMKKLGATETIFPEKESAQSLAARMINPDSLLNYMRLGSGLSIQEMAVPNAWIGKTLMELALRQRFKVSIVAVHDNLRDDVTIPPDPTAPLKDSDTLLVVGKEEALSRVARLS